MTAPTLASLKVKLFTDGADKAQIVEMAKQSLDRRFHHQSVAAEEGRRYRLCRLCARAWSPPCPTGIFRSRCSPTTSRRWWRRRRVIATWGKNVYVKLPVTTTRGEPLFEAVRALSRDGVKINMTAIFTPEQVERAVAALDGGAPACVSVFAGRLADFGIDYRPIMQDAVARARKTKNVEIIWASTREVFNVVEARRHGLPHHHRARRCAQEIAGARHARPRPNCR